MVTNCPSYGHNGSAYKIRAEKGLRRPEYRGSIQVPEAADLSSARFTSFHQTKVTEPLRVISEIFQASELSCRG